MAANELNVDALKDIKKNDYKKLFLKKSLWRKAEGVLILVDYKLEGKKKSFVAIPYRKIKDATDEYKKIKSDKLHGLQKTALCLFKLSNDENSAELEIKKGGLAAAKLQVEAEMPFGMLPISIAVTGVGDDAGEIPQETEPDKDEQPKPLPQEKQNLGKEQIIALASKIASALKDISNDYKQVKGTIVANLKANKSTEDDAKLVEGLLAKIRQLMEDYATAPVQVKDKFAGEYEAICTNIQPQMESVLEKLEWAMVPTTNTKNKELGKVLSDARSKLRKFLQDIEDLEREITKQPSTSPPAGKELLDMLG